MVGIRGEWILMDLDMVTAIIPLTPGAILAGTVGV